MGSPFDWAEGQAEAAQSAKSSPKDEAVAQAMPAEPAPAQDEPTIPPEVSPEAPRRASSMRTAPGRSPARSAPPTFTRRTWGDPGEMPDAEPTNRLGIDPNDFPDQMDLQWCTASSTASRSLRISMRISNVVGNRCKSATLAENTTTSCQPATRVRSRSTASFFCTRPKKWSEKAKAQERRDAANAVLVKQKQLEGGDLEGVTMGGGSRHPNALRFNRINKTYAPLDVPNEGVMD